MLFNNSFNIYCDRLANFYRIKDSLDKYSSTWFSVLLDIKLQERALEKFELWC